MVPGGALERVRFSLGRRVCSAERVLLSRCAHLSKGVCSAELVLLGAHPKNLKEAGQYQSCT